MHLFILVKFSPLRSHAARPLSALFVQNIYTFVYGGARADAIESLSLICQRDFIFLVKIATKCTNLHHGTYQSDKLSI